MSLDVYKLTDKKARLIWVIIVFITHLLADHEPIKIHSISGSIRVMFVSVVKKRHAAGLTFALTCRMASPSSCVTLAWQGPEGFPLLHSFSALTDLRGWETHGKKKCQEQNESSH